MRLGFLKLEHKLKRALRALMSLMRQRISPPATIYPTAQLDLPTLL